MQQATNEEQVAAFLASKGLSAADIAGLMGNFQIESGFNPAALNAKEGAIGLAQWENGRRTNLDSYATQTGGSEQSLATQEGFLWSELTGPYASVLAAIKSMSDPAQVAATVDAKYEVSAGTSRTQRIAAAQQIYQQLQNGGDLATVAANTGTSDTSATGTSTTQNLLGMPSVSDIGKILFEGAVVVGGLALVVVGLARATQPTRDAITKHMPAVIPV